MVLGAFEILVSKMWSGVQVVAQLKGDELLPWEGDGEHALRLRHQLGHFKKAVLSLLRRNPAKRASLSQFQSLVSVAAQR